MKRLVRIITYEAGMLWILSGMALNSESLVPVVVFTVASAWILLVLFATYGYEDFKKRREENEEI